jgi:hypothetical protein
MLSRASVKKKEKGCGKKQVGNFWGENKNKMFGLP